jgi:AcrR family transcriptional regulator
MTTTKRASTRQALRAGKKRRAAKRAAPYHHGSLREAMLRAAESILERDGIRGLTLRAAAREAGVSHAAPKNHFGDVMGLLSDLAAVGFARFRAAMEAHIRKTDPAPARLEAIGRGYVTFARTHPDLFLLMFRSERLALAVRSGRVTRRLAGSDGVCPCAGAGRLGDRDHHPGRLECANQAVDHDHRRHRPLPRNAQSHLPRHPGAHRLGH